MKSVFIALIGMCMLSLASCEKDKANIICPINYSVDTGANEALQQKWFFVGFSSDSSDDIDYPPCSVYDKDASFQMTLSFTDTVNTVDTAFFEYDYLFSGRSVVNGYGGSYTVDEVAQTISTANLSTTEVTGPPELNDYEDRYYGALTNSSGYRINHNELFLYYSQSEYLLFVAE